MVDEIDVAELCQIAYLVGKLEGANIVDLKELNSYEKLHNIYIPVYMMLKEDE